MRFQYAAGAKVEFQLTQAPTPELVVRVRERGAGIKDLQAIMQGRYDPQTPVGLGMLGAKRLMDRFAIESSEGGAIITMVKGLPKGAGPRSQQDLARISTQLAQLSPQGLLEELRTQNQELLGTLQELRERQVEIAELHNRELDLTNRGVLALYSELDENAKELSRISDLKSRYLSNMSHEFRSPLNTILSMSAFLLSGSSGVLTAEQKKEIGFIRKAAEGLASLVNDLLDLSKVEAGKAVVRSEPFEVSDLFEALRGTTQPLLVEGSVALVIEEPAGIPTLQTDEVKLTQILRNFLSNAAKFTEKGEIRLAAKMGPGDTIIFTVTDTGIGIAPEDQRRIFEEFSQVEGPVQKRVRGTGLGLPLSRKLAELLGGNISVHSQLGVGSTFIAVLPRSYPAAEASEGVTESRRQLNPNLAPVLVVEDDPVTLLLYEKILEGSAFQVVPARTLAEARRVLNRIRPRAVLLDVLLDGESGWTLLAEMKGNDATKDIPIYVLTVVDGKERALELGATDFCLKPIDAEWLVGRLNALEAEGDVDTILIIDDEEADRYRLRELLTAHGRFAIVEAASGEDGLKRAREVAPDVIFLDLILADMTGFEVLERLKSDDAVKDVPVIINSSADLSEDERQRLAPGTTAILSKSAGTAEEALAAIRDALIRAGLSLMPTGIES